MPLISEVNDITKIKVDAIANSFGLKGKQFGRICTSIFKAVDDEDIKNIFVNANYDIGELFITKAGKLPCNYIINIVTPFEAQDDNLEKLIKAYKDVINKAIELKCKSIAIPMMGTGANGYTRAQSNRALKSAIEDLLALEEEKGEDILEVKFLIYFAEDINYSIDDIDNRRISNISFIGNERISNFDENGQLIVKKYFDPISDDEILIYQQKIMFMFQPKKYEMFRNGPFDNPYLFLDAIREKNGLSQYTINEWGIDRRVKSDYKRGTQKMTRYQLFMAFIAFRLNATEVIKVMSCVGKGFNVSDPVDRFVIDYFLGELPFFKDEYDFKQFFNKYKFLEGIELSLQFPRYE